MVALFFAAYPEEAEIYIAEVECQQQEAEEYQEKIYDLAEKRIRKMTKAEAQQALYEMVFDAPDWMFERFVRDWVENDRDQ